MRLAVDRLQDSDLCRNKLKSTSAAASAGCGGISWSCGAAPLPNAETTMDQSDDILDTPQLGYEAWRDRLRAMCGRYNPEGIEPNAFTGWVRPVSVCGFTALDIFSPAPSQCCSMRSIAIAARARRRSRSSTFTFIPAGRPWSA
jgi:hypothetical protein